MAGDALLPVASRLRASLHHREPPPPLQGAPPVGARSRVVPRALFGRAACRVRSCRVPFVPRPRHVP
eukprot:6609398-Prymnesium_polylepis.2